MSDLKNAIHSVYRDCLKLKQHERFLIFADQPQQSLACEFLAEANVFNKAPHLIIGPALSRANIELPVELTKLFEKQDCMILLTSHSLSHTKTRRNASRKGVRIVSMPGIHGESLIRTMTADYKPMIHRSQKLADILTIGCSAHLTTSAGTDLTFSLVRMKGFADTGMVHMPGQFANLPAGEAAVAPAEGSVNGILIVDGSFPAAGRLKTPVEMRVTNGFVTRISGNTEAEEIRKLLRPFGKKGKCIAELGIGTNPYAEFTGFTLEDEKKLGTVHIALGNNLSFDGKNNVPCHFDSVLLNPTLTIDGKKIMENGELLV